MKVALAQLNPKIGAFEANLDKAFNVLNQVRDQGPDLVVFPELYLMGYPPHDLLEKDWFVKKQLEALDRLARATADRPELGLVVGAALPGRREYGRGLTNSAVLLHQGRIVFSQAKSLLPTYDVFDEARYFDPADQVRPVPFKGIKLGLSVCEDAWNDPDLWPKGRLYDQDPIAALAVQGVDLFINVSASPFHLGKDEIRHGLLKNYASRRRAPFILVNQVGGNDELIFDGSSLCLDKKGELLARGRAFAEEILTVDLDRAEPGPPFEPLDRIGSVYQALCLGIRDYLWKTGFKSAVVGLSGGIDSAVTFALAVCALGVENVVGISMPSMYSSTGSVEDSRALAANLDADFRVIPIKGVYDAYVQSLAEAFAGRDPDVTEENIQARIRGNILMAFSNKYGHLVLSTGNKSELAMGYCTLYGDMSGGLAVISDLPKMMVYELAEYINREREIIPRAIIDKAPSAELRPDQKDEDSLPPYPVLDRILHLSVEEGLDSDRIIERGFDPDMVRWIVRTVGINEYKRRQAAPGLKITSKAFGLGRRMPIAARHDF